ncbi:MAG: carboxypeptidase-like regulatory domain-containing protein [Gemmatimonadota bacterium]|nr:carboxypeptidase-like regulatory domain-containing protein [Gemmatimonadota bacterium]
MQSSSTAGTKSFQDVIGFDRPPVIGCFTLEALALNVIYEPPGSGSSQVYSTTSRFGTTVRTFSASESSVSKPLDTPFSQVTDFIKILGGAGKVLSAAGSISGNAGVSKAGSIVSGASDFLGAVWGSSATDSTITTTVSEEHTLSLEKTGTSGAFTTEHLGPGKGDVIVFFIHPVFHWLAFEDPATGQVYLTTAFFSYEKLGSFSARALRSGNPPDISAAARTLLLSADAVALEALASPKPVSRPSGRGAVGLPGSVVARRERLVPAVPPELEFQGSGQADGYRHSVTQEDVSTETEVRNVTTKNEGGFLGFIADKVPQLGLDVPQSGQTSLSTIHSSSSGITVGKTVLDSVTFSDSAFHDVKLLYDRVFGTIAFEDVTPGDTAASGSVAFTDGSPAPRQKVEIVTRDGTFRSWTDARGRFAFRSKGLKPGTYTLVVGDKQQPLTLTGSRVTTNIVVPKPPR